MVCASLPVACEAHPVEIRVWRSRSSSSSGIEVMEIWIKVFVQREQSYRDLTVCLAGFRLWRSGLKSSSSGNKVMEIWIKVFVQREPSYGDLDQSLHPAGTKLRRLELRL
jgi:hypothetical protein